MRLRRIIMGLSQQALGRLVGLTFQQIQKYEKGDNRVSASTLYRLAEALDVPVSFFFDDLPEDMAAPGRTMELSRRESLELLRHYYRISGPMRKPLYDLVKAMGRSEGAVAAAKTPPAGGNPGHI
jgi:Predicted transcriptional regulators